MAYSFKTWCVFNYLTLIGSRFTYKKNNYTGFVIVWLIHAFWIIILKCQQRYGTRFMLPERFRNLKFNYKRKLFEIYTVDDIREGDVHEWELWCTPLSMPSPLFWENKSRLSRKMKWHPSIFVQTPWMHSFHFIWLNESLKKFKEWPKWWEEIPYINEFDD